MPPLSPLSGTLSECGRFRLVDQIGAGGESYVYSATRVADGAWFAVKVVTEMSATDDPYAHVLAAVQHESLVLPVEPAIIINGCESYVLPLHQQDLRSLLVEHPAGMPVEAVRALVRSALVPLRLLHTHGLVHGDIKPANYLISASGHLFLADFGSCRLVEDRGMFPITTQYVCGHDQHFQTRGAYYRPTFETRTLDIYAFGVMVTEMLLGPTYPARDPADAVASIARACPCAADFVQQCTSVDFNLRPSVTSLFEHAWLRCDDVASAADTAGDVDML